MASIVFFETIKCKKNTKNWQEYAELKKNFIPSERLLKFQ